MANLYDATCQDCAHHFRGRADENDCPRCHGPVSMPELEPRCPQCGQALYYGNAYCSWTCRERAEPDPYTNNPEARADAAPEVPAVDLCEVCGYTDGEHNPEAHAAEARADYYAQWEPVERDDYDRDRYDDGPADAQCIRCNQWGVAWNIDRGPEGVICTDCDRPEDWAPESD